MKNIDELSVLFQQLDGKFENVEIRYSEDADYYCYSLNSNKNSIISCPASLLVDVDDIDINEEGLFISRPEKYGNKIDFLRKYFVFHFNKTVISQQTKREQHIDSLSDKDLSLISNIFST